MYAFMNKFNGQICIHTTKYANCHSMSLILSLYIFHLLICWRHFNCQYDKFVMCTEACMDKGGGGNTRGVFGGVVGVYWWMEVRQWHVQIGLPGTTCSDGGGEVFELQCPIYYCYWLSYKDVEAIILGNNINEGLFLQWVRLEWWCKVHNCWKGIVRQLYQGMWKL